MYGSCELYRGCVFQPCLYSQSNISSGSVCAVLPHSPVCSVKSDEFGNEKQVCVNCVDHSFISFTLVLPPPSLPPDLSEPGLLSCVLWQRGWREEAEQRKHRRRDDDPWERARPSWKVCRLFCALGCVLTTTAWHHHGVDPQLICFTQTRNEKHHKKSVKTSNVTPLLLRKGWYFNLTALHRMITTSMGCDN